jgi:hypothetical protein
LEHNPNVLEQISENVSQRTGIGTELLLHADTMLAEAELVSEVDLISPLGNETQGCSSLMSINSEPSSFSSANESTTNIFHRIISIFIA